MVGFNNIQNLERLLTDVLIEIKFTNKIYFEIPKLWDLIDQISFLKITIGNFRRRSSVVSRSALKNRS